jgi:adenylyltransferase/sulfurtransferase
MAGLGRYSRQLGILGGLEGQKRLESSTVTIVGLGGLGSPVSTYLAAAGVGHLGLIDRDTIEPSDLNRQFLCKTEDVGKGKAWVAGERLRELNGEIEVQAISGAIEGSNCSDLVGESDVVVDCLDNWESRLILNEACVELSIPLVHGAVEAMSGQITTVIPKETPCLNCIFSALRERGTGAVQVVGFLPGLVGSIQAGEAIKLITGVGELLRNRLLIADLATCSFDIVGIIRDRGCKVCGD